MMAMPRVFIFLLGVICIISCTPRSKAGQKTAIKPMNLVVLLDLSDRLTTPEQVQRDTQLLHHIYRLFENRAKRQFYIQCKDRLQVLVMPQKSLPAGSIEGIESRLRILMPEVPLKERASFLKKNEVSFFNAIDSLYIAATGKRNASEYSGSDTWKFFDQYLRNYMVQDTGTINKVVVLTDGYLDFESLKDKKEKGCRYSYSGAIMRQARNNKNNYRLLFDSCGLIPVVFNQTNISVLAAEISPKLSFENEAVILETMWQSWIRDMHIGTSQVIRKSDLPEVKSILSRFIL
jgi:hypothetical protein